MAPIPSNTYLVKICWTGTVLLADALVTTSLAPGLTLLEGAGGNVLALATEAGKVVVDAGDAAHSRALIQALDGLPGGKVTALFNTHWHPEQVGGNEALGAAGATIFAHAKTRQRLSAGYYLRDEDRYQPPLAPAGRPTKTFHTEGAVTVGSRGIEYGYLVEAHTDGDIFVFFPHANVIAVGGALSPHRDPELDWFGGGWLGGRLDSLARCSRSATSARASYRASVGPLAAPRCETEQKLMRKLFERMVEHVRLGESAADMQKAVCSTVSAAPFADPAKLLYDRTRAFGLTTTR